MIEKNTSAIAELFAPLIGQLAWSVRGGYGTYVTIEFGAPHLRIEEPRINTRAKSARVRRHLARRRIFVTGDWHFWIESADWQVTTASGSTSSDEASSNWWKDWLDDIDGQRLVAVESPGPACLTLHFDLGGIVAVRPDPDFDSQCWSLHPWQHDIVACLPDGTLV